MPPRFQFSLKSLLVVTALVAIAIAIADTTLTWWFPWLYYVTFFARVIVKGLFEALRDSPRKFLMGLLTLSIPVMLIGVFAWAFVAALREKRR